MSFDGRQRSRSRSRERDTPTGIPQQPMYGSLPPVAAAYGGGMRAPGSIPGIPSLPAFATASVSSTIKIIDKHNAELVQQMTDDTL